MYACSWPWDEPGPTFEKDKVGGSKSINRGIMTSEDHENEAGNLAGGMPVMIDFGVSISPLSIEELLMKRLRPGDIFTHCFAQLENREYVVDGSSQKMLHQF